MEKDESFSNIGTINKINDYAEALLSAKSIADADN